MLLCSLQQYTVADTKASTLTDTKQHNIMAYGLSLCIVPGKVENLACTKRATPSELTFYWELPILLGGEVIDYLVEVKELRHRDGTRDVIQVDVDGFNTAMKQANVNQGLGTVIIPTSNSLTTTEITCTITVIIICSSVYIISTSTINNTMCCCKYSWWSTLFYLGEGTHCRWLWTRATNLLLHKRRR